MKSVTLQIPDSVNEREVLMQLAAILFEKGIMTSGQGAEMAGVSKRAFLETVGKYGVSIFSEDTDDIRKALNG
jgi:predicted HTH domain antitoxin